MNHRSWKHLLICIVIVMFVGNMMSLPYQQISSGKRNPGATELETVSGDYDEQLRRIYDVVQMFEVNPIQYAQNALVDSDSASCVVCHRELTFPDVEIRDVGSFVSLVMDNCSYLNQPGYPQIPIRGIVIKIPYNSKVCDIDITINDTTAFMLSKKIVPALEPISLGDIEAADGLNTRTSRKEVLPDASIYDFCDIYPKDWYSTIVKQGLDPASHTRVQYVVVWVYPVRYIPSNNEILFAQNISVRITYEPVLKPSTLSSGILNLIITSPFLEEEALRLSDFKNSIGIESSVVDTSWIYANYVGNDSQEQIRNCIKQYVANHDIRYVTIFGDADQVPVRLAYVPYDEVTYVATDLYYADVDGSWDDNGDGLYGDLRYDTIDGVPDVFIGRIPPSLVSSAEGVVDKIIDFFTSFNASESWANKTIWAAGVSYVEGSDFGSGFMVLNNFTATLMSDMNVVKLYEPLGTLDESTLISEINTGCFFLNLAGHGSPASWLIQWVVYPTVAERLDASEALSLLNGLKLPVVTTMSCATARFDEWECIGENFVLNPSGGGIGYFGSTRTAYGYPDEGIINGLMGELNWRSYEAYSDGYTHLGEIWGRSISAYLLNHPLSVNNLDDELTVLEYVLLGDPTVNAKARPNIVFVDDDYTSATSGWGYDHFAQIQHGVNVVQDGGFVFVSNGIYHEQLDIHKSLVLIGEDIDSTILDGNETGVVVNCSAEEIGLYSVTVRNGEVGVQMNSSSSNFVMDCLIIDNGYGIRLDVDADNNVIYNCTIVNNTDYGVYGISSDYTRIKNCLIQNNSCGCALVSLCFHTEINNCSVLDNAAYGVYLSEADFNKIHNSTILYNGDGIYFWGSNSNTIMCNRVIGNQKGIVLTGSTSYPSETNIIFDNIVCRNFEHGIYLSASAGSNSLNHNDCIANAIHAYTVLGTNIWDDGYPSGGNFWDDYTGVDADGDGIGDTPYTIPGPAGSQDRYPLVEPWGLADLPTMNLVPQTLTVPENTDIVYNLTIDRLPAGLSEYNITLSFEDGAIADVTGISFPTWSTIHSNGSLPSDNIWIDAIDLNNHIISNATNTTLATLTITSIRAGETPITIMITRLENDTGDPIISRIQDSFLTVLSLPKLPGHGASPTDPDGDGLVEDFNGNGLIEFDDVVQFFDYFEWIAINLPEILVDMNRNGRMDFDDIVCLFEEV